MATSASNSSAVPAMSNSLIALLGGTFDPIHLGHLRLALEIKQALAADEMRLIPCHQPPHRASPKVGSAERLTMLQLAVKDCAELRVDDRELKRDGSSYTVDTLRDLRAEVGEAVSLVLCMGTDAFEKLSTWKEWQSLIDYAHILVIARPGYELPSQGLEFDFWQKHQADVNQLREQTKGFIAVQALRLLPISATEIRQHRAEQQSIQYLVPEAVRQYIETKQLYQ